jgi:hypothetical protein
VKAAVHQSKEPSQAENWAVEAHHRLAQQRGKKPETTAGQVWAVWPDIKSALAEGQRIGTIRRLLEEQAGIEITTATLTTYISRCRRKESRSGRVSTGAGSLTVSADLPRETRGDDPMAGAREALSKPRFDIRKLHGDGDPSDRNLI